MVVRKIKPEENVESNKIGAIAFLDKRDFSEKPKELPVWTGEYEIYGAFADNGEMMSRLCVIQYQVMFDGHIVSMGGIGGVATLPEHRGKGAVKGMLFTAMKDMYERGQVFSYLYPFSHEFYRKFGYELCYQRAVTRYPLKDFHHYSHLGSLRFFNKDDDTKTYSDIYKRFISDKNLAVVRTEKQFNNLMNKDPYASQQYTYMWSNGSGAEKSYITFSIERRNEKTGMFLHDFAWVDDEGFMGMISSLGNFSAQIDYVAWEAPDMINPRLLVSEPDNMTTEVLCCGMNRVVDVKRAFELLKKPDGSGCVRIAVRDEFLSWNDGIYKIEWDNGSTVVESTTEDADMELSVQTLAQLVCGYITPQEASLAGKLTINRNSQECSKLFYKKHLYISDRF